MKKLRIHNFHVKDVVFGEKTKYENEILSLEQELSKIPDTEVESRQKAFERKERKYFELKAELKAYQEKFAADIKVKCKASLEVAKKAIARYLDESEQDYIKEVKKDFSNRIATQIITMEQLIGHSVISKIETKKKEIELLENKLKDAVEARDSSVNKLNMKLQGVNTLMNKALDLESDIESIRVDVIKEQTI